LIVDNLRRGGAEVLIHDPLFARDELANFEAEVVDLDSDKARSSDAIVVQAMHRDFAGLDWHSFKNLRAVLDGRGTRDAEKIRQAGAAYIAIGISETRAAAPK
jgi:UDP-N-acetyl-D-mannosaminuronate dehydrogenase